MATAFETPHTEWAKPYAGGKVRALFFMDIGYCGTVPREVVELKQRLDLEAEVVFWANIIDSPNYHWHGDAAGMRRMKRLLSQAWDCFVFVNSPVERLPVEEQYRALLAVTKGAGLVLIGTDDQRVLKPSRQDKELPAFLATGTPLTGLSFARDSVLKGVPEETATDALAASKMVATFKVKEGRGVRLPGTPNLEYRVGWDTEYEYWIQLVSRALLWAAGKEPKVSAEVEVKQPIFDRAALPTEALSVTYQNQGDAKPLAFNLTLRRYDGLQVELLKERTSQTSGSFIRAIPQLRAGRYFVDLQITSKAGAETWSSISFLVTSPRVIREVLLDQPWGEVGDVLSGTVSLGGLPSPKEAVRVDLCDRRNRVIARQETPVRNGKASFKFQIEPWMPMLIRVEATLVAGGQEVAGAYEYFNVTKRHRGQFNFVMWDTPRGTLAPYAEESLAKLGITVHLTGGTPSRAVAAYDLAWVPYTTRITSPKDEKGYMLPICWNHEPDITNYVRGIVQPHEKSRQHGVFVYSLGDEGVTRGACVHPDCLAAFRRYLAKEYDTIEALNRSWGTDFKSFDEVSLPSPDDSEAAEARRQGNYPRWYDRQAFQSANFAGLCKRFVDEFAKLDPQARVGFEGAGSFDAGDDYDLIVRTNGFWSPYPGLGDEIIRSIAPRDFPRSNWMGYTKDADSLLSKYWRMITRGNDSVWWWRWDGVGVFHGFLAPHLGPYEATRELVKDTEVVRNGLGTLLIKAQMQDDGIALLYSMPSAYATQVEKGPTYGSYAPSHEVWSRTLRELGLQYRYVTDRMLRLGEFDASKFKVLILARTEAIGPKEADAIRRFVEDGGMMIADLRPGIYDGHCKAREAGVLDALFGIKRSAGNADPVTEKAILTLGQARVEFDKATCDPAVQLAGGSAAGNCGSTPLLVTNMVGKGRAVLLNFNLGSYPALGNDRTPEAAADLFKQLLAEAEVRPTIAVTKPDGTRTRNLETVRWRNGDTEIVALFREGGQSEEARVALPEPLRVYNLRNHRTLGKLKSFDTRIIACRATFFALAPQPVRAAKVQLSDRVLAQGKLLTATVQVPEAKSLHAVRLNATLPNGQPADWLNTVLIVPPDGASASLPIAYNDPKGRWTLVATELYTDKATTAAFVVR